MGRRVFEARLKAVIGADGKVDVARVSDSQVSQRLAWHAGLVVFPGEPVREALAQINRYSHGRIVVVFSATDIQSFISATTETLGVEAVGSGTVALLRGVNRHSFLLGGLGVFPLLFVYFFRSTHGSMAGSRSRAQWTMVSGCHPKESDRKAH